MSDVAVIGAGYVGLTTAACLAHLGSPGHVRRHRRRAGRRAVQGRDPDPRGRAAGAGRRRPVLAPADVRRRRGERGGASPSSCSCACRRPRPTTAPRTSRSSRTSPGRSPRSCAPGAVVINKSTMPVGSTRLVQRILAEAGAAIDQIGVASNPEFLREGSSVRDFLQPNRVVIGCDDPSVAVRVSELYRSLNAPMLVTDPASAEMIKYASNAFLATKISFMNAIANLCETVDADVREVALGMGYDQRIGFEFLHPGPGYGGSCFPKDTAALLYAARSSGYDFSLLEGVVEVNLRQHERMVEKVRNLAGGSLDGAPGRGVGPHVQGQHRRPARLAGARDRPPPDRGGRDGCGRTTRRRGSGRPSSCPGSRWSRTRTTRATVRSVLAVLTEWDEFRWLDFDRVLAALAQPAGARRPQPARPGRAPPARLHLRGSRPLVEFGPRRRATDIPAAGRGHRRGRIPRVAPLGAADRRGLGRRRARQHAHRAHGEHRRICCRGPSSRSSATTSRTSCTSTGRSTRCCTSRAPRARRTTSSTRSRR